MGESRFSLWVTFGLFGQRDNSLSSIPRDPPPPKVLPFPGHFSVVLNCIAGNATTLCPLYLILVIICPHPQTMMGTKGVMGDPNGFHLLGDWAVTNVRKKWGSTERVLGAMGVSQTRGRNGSQGRCWV